MADNSALYKQITQMLNTFGYPCTIYVEPDRASHKRCPCTSNAWNQYSELWHIRNKDKPNCHKTGYLPLAGGDGYFVAQTIQAAVIPHFAYVGKATHPHDMGMSMEWEWLGITQDPTRFNRLIDAYGSIYILQNTMPYRVGGDGKTPVVLMYGLIPVNTDVPIP